MASGQELARRHYINQTNLINNLSISKVLLTKYRYTLEMAAKSLFEISDYKAYLTLKLEELRREKRGERTRLAEAMTCNVAYISQVLSGNAHLSLEQAERASRFFHHSKAEEDYFLLLVQLGRAGSPQLRKYFDGKLEAIREANRDLKTRLNYQKTLADEDRATYYSSWYYTAIHFLASIEGMGNPKLISEYLGLSSLRTLEVLQFLTARGLVEQDENGNYKTGPTNIHLGSDSPMLPRHHSNWRMQAIADIEKGDSPKNHLHYSSVITLSAADIPKVREALVQAIENVRGIVRPSASEKLYCYTLDLFEIGRSKK